MGCCGVRRSEAPNLTDSFDADKRRRLTYNLDTDPTGIFVRELIASVGMRIEEVLFRRPAAPSAAMDDRLVHGSDDLLDELHVP